MGEALKASPISSHSKLTFYDSKGGIIMANINYVKAGEAWFNLNQIDAIYPCPSRMYGDDNWVIIVSGKEINLKQIDATTVVDAIKRYNGYFTSEPKQDTETIQTSSAQASTKTKAAIINSLRAMIAELNKNSSAYQFRVDVDDSDIIKIVLIGSAGTNYLSIEDGYIFEDRLTPYITTNRASELLAKINEILA